MSATAYARPSQAMGPAETQNFAVEADRQRLSKAALTAYVSLSAIWDLTQAQAAALIGVSASTWERMRKGTWENALTQDQLTRVSAMIGILKGLRLLFADSLSDRWPKMANKGPLFQGRSPVESMIEGGIPLMLEVRRYVDALRGGL